MSSYIALLVFLVFRQQDPQCTNYSNRLCFDQNSFYAVDISMVVLLSPAYI